MLSNISAQLAPLIICTYGTMAASNTAIEMVGDNVDFG